MRGSLCNFTIQNDCLLFSVSPEVEAGEAVVDLSIRAPVKESATKQFE